MQVTVSGKIFVSHATFSKYLLLYIKPENLELTVTIPSADVLIEQCIKGDMSAYRLLYERYSKAMYNTALRISGNRADAEDILQESFIDAFVQLRSFENKATFGAWLKQIVVFKSIALLKKRKLSFADLEKETEELADENMPDENEIEFTVQGIKKAMNQLPDGYRAVLSLYLLEGYDHEEIAEIMRISQSTVRTQYKRGKQKLLQILKKEDVHE
ncbi:MAG: RNA polymerase sigma factor [Chitinophagaceae bacterium]